LKPLSAISSSILLKAPVALFNGYANSKLRTGISTYCHDKFGCINSDILLTIKIYSLFYLGLFRFGLNFILICVRVIIEAARYFKVCWMAGNNYQ